MFNTNSRSVTASHESRFLDRTNFHTCNIQRSIQKQPLNRKEEKPTQYSEENWTQTKRNETEMQNSVYDKLRKRCQENVKQQNM